MGALKFDVSINRRSLFVLLGNDRKARILDHFIFLTPKKGKNNFRVYMEEEMTRAMNDDENLQGGWIWKSCNELIEEAMLSVTHVTARNYLKDLCEKGYLFERSNPENKWDKTKQYRVNMLKLIYDLNKLGRKLESFPDGDILLERIVKEPESLISPNVDNLKSNENNLKSILDNLKAITEHTTKSTSKRIKKNKLEEEEDGANFEKSYPQDKNKKDSTTKKESENKSNSKSKSKNQNEKVNYNEIPSVLRRKYREIFGRQLSIEFFNTLKKIISDEDIIHKAMLVAEQKGDKPTYLVAVLRDWKEKELLTISDIDNYIENKAYKSSGNTKSKSKSKSSINKVFAGLNSCNIGDDEEKRVRDKRKKFKSEQYR